MSKTVKKLTKLKSAQSLNIETGLINKEEVFKMIALAQTTGLPMLLVGNPGVAKTKTVLDYSKAWLMSGVDETDEVAVQAARKGFLDKIYILETDEGTKSSEVKGMPDFEELFENNKYKLNAPISEAEVVIINEVDKSSSNIRNSLLGVMNEKFLFNGKTKLACKWKLFVATCNEIPKEEMGSPFWDRFMLKMNVNRISAGDLVKYFDGGAKAFKQTLQIGIPSTEEMDLLSIPTSKLEKFLEVAYNALSDRTLTFVPTLIKAVSFIWNISLDKALVKVAGMMIGSQAASELQSKLLSPEMKSLISKVEMLWTINDGPGLDSALFDIETLLTGYAASGKIDEDQVSEIEISIQYILENHPVKKQAEAIEDDLAEIETEFNSQNGNPIQNISYNPIKADSSLVPDVDIYL